MIQHVWSVVCQSTSIDTDTNRISLFNVLENLTIFTQAEEPITLPIGFEIFTLWTRSHVDQPCKGRMRVYYCHPSGETTNPFEVPIDLSQAIYFRSRTRSQGLALTTPGRYVFLVEIQDEGEDAWRRVAELPVLVNFQPPDLSNTDAVSEQPQMQAG